MGSVGVLFKKYSPLDWRVALLIAVEVAKEKFCKFKDKKTAMEIGIRAGDGIQMNEYRCVLANFVLVSSNLIKGTAPDQSDAGIQYGRS